MNGNILGGCRVERGNTEKQFSPCVFCFLVFLTTDNDCALGLIFSELKPNHNDGFLPVMPGDGNLYLSLSISMFDI